jgi:hypothetical protein
MTYLPELRETLVRAADRQAAGLDAEPARRAARRRARPFGAFALMAASVVAIVVAGAVLVLARHPSGAPQSASGSTGPSPAQVHAAAASLLGLVRLPAGAVACATDPAPRSQISAPPDKLLGRYTTDLHRYYQVPGTPQQVIDAIMARPPRGTQSQSSSAAGEASSATGKAGAAPNRGATPRVTFAGTTFELSRVNGIARELAFQAVQMPGGGTALRVDAQAGYGPGHVPGHAPNIYGQPPVGNGQAQVSPPVVPRRLAHRGTTIAIHDPSQRARALRFLNALPSLTNPPPPMCFRRGAVTWILLGRVAVMVTPGCPVVAIEQPASAAFKKWPTVATLRASDVKKLVGVMLGVPTRHTRPKP